MPATPRPRLNAVAIPIVGEFLLGMSVAMGGLWLASQTSDAAAGTFGLSIQVLETLFVLFRVLAIGVGVVTTQALGGQQHEAARRTALVGLGAGTWAGLLAALCVLVSNELILDVLNAPAGASVGWIGTGSGCSAMRSRSSPAAHWACCCICGCGVA